MRGPAWIVLPTYCEAENLEPMARALRTVLPDDARILVVDDASPDGTGAVADRLAAEDPRLAVLHRPGKAGLGPAYLAGFAHALAHGAGAVVEMDCDFSHDPEAVPALLGALADGADLALGSRYVPGGRVENWSAWRRAVSRAGCRYAQLRAARAGPRPHRRLQGVPGRGAARDRLRAARARRATRSRSS